MYRSLAEAAANCTRNIATGYGPLFSDRKALGAAAVLTRGQPEMTESEVMLRNDPVEQVARLVEALKETDCSTRVSAVCDLARLGG